MPRAPRASPAMPTLNSWFLEAFEFAVETIWKIWTNKSSRDDIPDEQKFAHGFDFTVLTAKKVRLLFGVFSFSNHIGSISCFHHQSILGAHGLFYYFVANTRICCTLQTSARCCTLACLCMHFGLRACCLFASMSGRAGRRIPTMAGVNSRLASRSRRS